MASLQYHSYLVLIMAIMVCSSCAFHIMIHPSSRISTKSSSSSPTVTLAKISEEDDFVFPTEDEEEQNEDDGFFNPVSPTETYAALTPEEFEQHVPKINCVTLVGRIGQNPEPRYFDDGKVVLRLGLAVKRKYHPLERQARNIRSGEEETDWFNLELWGRDAEYAGKYVTKGARVGITGSLNIDSWVDKMSGEERSSAKIIVRQLDILESRAEAELRQGNSNQNSGGYNSNYSSNNEGGKSGFDYGDGPSSASGTGGFFDD